MMALLLLEEAMDLENFVLKNGAYPQAFQGNYTYATFFFLSSFN